jgi:PKD repeat protein
MYNDLKFNNNLIRDCFTKYYTYFVYDYYGDKKQYKGNKIVNNTTGDGSTGYTYVFYQYYPSRGYTSECNNNVIDSNTFGSYTYGFYQYYWNGTFNNNIITNNRIYNANYSSYYGYIYATALQYFYNFQCNNNLIANNLGYYGAFGLYAYSYNSGSYTFECRQNTIQCDASKSPYAYHYMYGLYAYPYYHTTIDVVGNIVSIENSYGAYPAYTYSTSLSNYKRWDYNTYYLKNITYQYWYCPSGSASDFSSWQSLGFGGANENGVNPKFKSISGGDFASNAFLCHNNVPQSNGYWPVTTPNKFDVYGKTRNPFKSDRGAIESPMNIMAAKTDFSVPANVCAGYQTASNIYVTNRFIDTVYNFNVAYSINGGTKTSQLITSKIAPGQTKQVDFTVPISLNIAGATKIKIFVDAFDDTLSDDSFTFNTYVTPAPGGGSFIASPKATAAVYQYGKVNDVTVLNAPVYYDIPKPRKYTNSGYNTDWEAFVQAYTAGGKSITGATITAPSGSADMEVKFVTSDATLEDTMVTLVLRILDKNNNCDTFIKRKVLIYPSIDVDFGYPSKICDGDAVLFSNKCKVLSGSMEFMWNFGTGVAADTSAAPEPVFQFTGKGTYNVTLTAKTMPYGFTFSKTIPVTVNAIPTVGFTKANACQGKSLTFTNTTTPTTGTVMNWNFGDNTTSTVTNPTKKYSAPGTYIVTLKADLNGCVATMTQKVYQFDRPAANFVLANGMCDNETFNFTNKTAITSGLVGSYWDFDDNGSVSTDEHPSYKFATAGTKSVTLVSTSEFGCADTVKKNISVKESPKTAYINTPLCSVKPTTFTNTTKAVAGTNAVYAWDFGDGTTSTDESPTHDWNAKLGPKKVVYTITLDNGCSQSVSKDLVVLTQPKPNFSANDVCSGEDVVFVNNTTWPQGDISYKWDFGDGTTSTNSDPSKKYVTSVTYTPNVTLYAYIDGGCADSITQKITINEAPRTCDFVATPDYANGYYAIKVEPMNANGVVGGQALVNYVWVFEGGGTKQVSGVNAAVSNDFPSDGTYKVTMRAKMQQTSCECSVTKTVVMNRANAKELMNTGVSVYPNPASNVFNVALTETFGKNINIQVLSMSGQVVKNMSVENTGLISVDASAMSSGVYMIQISNGSEVVTRKMNIQK